MNEITNLAKYFASHDVKFETTRLLGEDYAGYTGAYYYKPSEEHLFVLSRTLREILDLKAPDVNDFANIRLSYWLNPTVLIGEDIINNYKLEGEDIPFFADPTYKSKYGDGFNIPKEQLENYEDNEGDTDVSQPDGQDYTEPTEEENLDESYDDDYYYDPGTNPRDEYFPPERDDRENYE